MEQSNLNQILSALSTHSEHIDKKIQETKVELENRMDDMKSGLEHRMDVGFKQVEERFEQTDKRFEQVDKRFDNLGKKMDGIRVDLSETQETTDFLSSKVIQHEQKIRATN